MCIYRIFKNSVCDLHLRSVELIIIVQGSCFGVCLLILYYLYGVVFTVINKIMLRPDAWLDEDPITCK